MSRVIGMHMPDGMPRGDDIVSRDIGMHMPDGMGRGEDIVGHP